MKRNVIAVLAIVMAVIAASAWMAMWLLAKRERTINVPPIVISDPIPVPAESADVSTESMIEKITALFDQNVYGRQNAVSYGDEICARILNMTNHAERTALARRYTDVLVSMPLASGPYYNRCDKLGNIWRMAAHWGDVLWRSHFEAKEHIGFFLAILGNFRDAAENGWKADESEVNAVFVETNDIQHLARKAPDKKLCVGGYRGRLAPGFATSNSPGWRFRTRKSTFVQYAITELRSVARIYREIYIPAIIRRMPPEEQEQAKKEVDEAFRKMGIEKLMDAMKQDLK